ncbi:protein fem-1 homolog C-like [Toxorhynchites rutilus septentrionalis]|uniref:protein fem-1 homolog C-like n=1 Tax=Toxorhynchites rutilus septentrionalis TaxID=329112 RepID=UPI00247A9085|nr:protein fem-1 homolog C-like [Toxorhynchites rutilus septentrionalis]
MNANAHEHELGDPKVLKQISCDLYREASSARGPLSRRLRRRIRRLPKHVRREVANAKHGGCSSLFIACREGNLEIVDYLLRVCDADIEQRGILTYPPDEEDELPEMNTINNVTLLWCACVSGHLLLATYLVMEGCDANAPSDTGSTPVRAACAISNIKMVKLLVEYGADIHKPTSNGTTCLIDAIESVPLCSYLISLGADVNERDSYGNTALHYAVESKTRNIEMVQLLLNHGADPFARKSSGDDALQLACIVGSVQIVDYLLSSVNYSQERKADAHMLLGSTLIYYQHNVENVLHRLRLAYEIRMGGGNSIRNRPSIPPRVAYGNMVEFTTIAEFEGIAHDVIALTMQGMVIQETILGVDHEYILHRLMIRGYFYKESRQFQMCLDLWMLALQVRIRKHTILDSETCDSARAVVKLMMYLVVENEPDMLQFKDVYETFQFLTSDLTESHQLLSIEPADQIQQKNYDCILHCLILLMYFLLTVANSEDEHRLIKSSVQELVRKDIRSVADGTLLHLSVSNTSVLRSKFFSHDREEDDLFSNLFVTKLLLECGAQVNTYDNTKSTPLLLASKRYYYEKEIVHTLIAHGAHLDSTNVFGERPSWLLKRSLGNGILPNEPASLKCLCANVITASGIPYRNKIPNALAQFVWVHDTCVKRL